MGLEKAVQDFFGIVGKGPSLGDAERNNLLAIFSQIVPATDGGVQVGEINEFWKHASPEERLIYASLVRDYLLNFKYHSIAVGKPPVPGLESEGREFEDYVNKNFLDPYLKDRSKVSDRQLAFIKGMEEFHPCIGTDPILYANHLYSKIAGFGDAEKRAAITEFIGYQNAVNQGSIFKPSQAKYDIYKLSEAGQMLIRTMKREIPAGVIFMGITFNELVNVGIEKGLFNQQSAPRVSIYNR